MEDINIRLEKELENIRYNVRVKENLLLTGEDISIIFKILKEQDLELKPMLDILEVLLIQSLQNDYLATEKYILGILKYYNIIKTNDLIHCRHKFFFSEDKKLIKKPFFCPAVSQKVSDELQIQNIFKKI